MLKFNPEAVPGFCPQPIYLIGTYNEDGSPNFAPISWVSALWNEGMWLVISMFGKKATKDNIFRSGVFSANLVNPGLLGLVDRFGCTSGKDGAKTAPGMEAERSGKLHVPILADSKWIYECEVAKTVEVGESHTFFAEVRNAWMDEALRGMDLNRIDLKRLDPVLWAASNYFSVGERIGIVGDFMEKLKD